MNILTQPPPFVQHTNPAKNSIRKAKRRMGARQFRKQLKAYRRQLKQDTLP